MHVRGRAPSTAAFPYWDMRRVREDWDAEQVRLPVTEQRRQKGRGLAVSWDGELSSGDVRVAFVCLHLAFRWEVQAGDKRSVVETATKGQESRQSWEMRCNARQHRGCWEFVATNLP